MAILTVQVPQGATGGSTLQITDPATGRPMQVQVPAGLRPGDTFNVEVMLIVVAVLAVAIAAVFNVASLRFHQQ